MNQTNAGTSNEAKYRALAAGLRKLERRAGISKFEISRMFKACQENKAYMVSLGEDFFVIRPHAGYAFLWMGAGSNGAFKRTMPMIEQMARNVGARYLEWHSKRKGWERFAKRGECVKFGMHKNGDTIYRRFL